MNLPEQAAPVLVRDLGRVAYEDALRVQEACVERVAEGTSASTILLCEHVPAVVTMGRGSAKDQHAPLPVPQASLTPFPVIPISRGGGLTYHGPGQLVAYPIIKLARHDLRGYLRALERAVALALAELGLPAGSRAAHTGVWTLGDPPRKLCSIGIACRRWVTYHGLAINVSTDLTAFQSLNPCGLPAEVMTSVSAELGREVLLNEVRDALVPHLVRELAALT